MAEFVPGGTPFTEAIRFFADKVNLPTRAWTDLWQDQHARAFVVAGAMKDELLVDFKTAIQKALDTGSTLADFRKDFDAIVARHGWQYRGGRNWRSRVIYDTNLRMARAAGRWEQIQRLKERRPYLRYVGVLDDRIRPEHRAWHGTVLPVDHPWWRTHYPPNGWRCRCTVMSLSERDLARYGYEVSEGPPPSPLVERTINTPGGPAAIQVPEGIDPGFGYNVGIAHSGTRLEEATMKAWGGERAWEPLGGRATWAERGRPALVPADKPAARRGPPAETADAMRRVVETAIGGSEKDFRLPDGTAVTVNAESLSEYLAAGKLDRAPMVPFLPETLTDPFEIWMAFERHKGTGQVRLMKRLVKVIELDRRHQLLVVTRVVGGRFVAWNFFQAGGSGYINRQRWGALTYAR